MIKKLLFSYLALCMAVCSKGQITIVPQVPPAGVIVKSQLWTMMVVSTADYASVSISLILKDATRGNTVLSGTSKTINIITGNDQYDFAALSPITYDYQSPDMGSDPDGFLITGSYIACYAVKESIHGQVTETCIPVIVEPTSPPLLNTPYDNEELVSYIPNFSWIPPMPVEIFSNLNYDFKLVEVQSGQSTVDAIQQNIPVYLTNQTDPFLYYPSSAMGLDTGKLYAWQVIANNNSTYAASSEIWSFRIVDNHDEDTLLVANELYLRLKNYSDGTVPQCKTQLRVAYTNASVDSAISYVVKDVRESDQPVISSGELVLRPGLNLLPVPGTNNLENGRIYLFQLFNSRNEVWSVKFQFQTPQE